MKTKLRDWFCDKKKFIKAPSPVYGETGVVLRYYTFDLIWRPLGRLVRFVWVIHPTARPAGFALDRFDSGADWRLFVFTAGASKSKSASSRPSTPSALTPITSGCRT